MVLVMQFNLSWLRKVALPLLVASCQGVLNGFRDKAVVLIPLGRSAVQRGELLRPVVLRVVRQQLSSP